MEVIGQLIAPATLLWGKEPPVPTGQETGWAPKPVWTQWQREESPVPARNSTPFIQPIA